MIYIEKRGLPESLRGILTEIRKSEEWKTNATKDTEAVRNIFDNIFPKNEVKEVLLREQKYLCAYCMKRIRMDSHSKIEHLDPLSANIKHAIDYKNLLGVCDGGESVTGVQKRILCCDAHKKNTKIVISPLNKSQMDKIAYKPDGTMYTDPRDEEMERDINEILLLNGQKKSDGAVLDTATEILKGRRDSYLEAERMMKTLDKKGKCNSTTIRKLMERLSNKDELDEFIGVKLFYFKRKYKKLLKRGL